jgi:putative ABC transport system permease protein
MHNRGRVILSGMDTLRGVMPSAEPLIYYAKAATGADPQTVVNSAETASGGRLLGEVVDSSPPVVIRQLPSIIGALAAFLNLIVLIGIFNAAFMNMRERTRELGVLKAVGMTPAQIIGMVFVGMGVYVALASIIALPLGVLATHLVLTNMAIWFGFTRAIPFAVNWFGLTLIPLGAFALAGVGSLLPALQAAQIKVTEALRYE